MTETFESTETDRTKSRWVAKALKEMGRRRTTIRAFRYYAIGRETPDYPICGGFVGEIRITRQYHESDAPKLSKWAGRARDLGFIDRDAIIDEIPGEHVFIPGAGCGGGRIELWVPRSDLIPLLIEACMNMGVTLVSAGPRPSDDAIDKLMGRSRAASTVVAAPMVVAAQTIILCLSDMSPSGLTFCRDLGMRIGEVAAREVRTPEIKMKRIGLTPAQAAQMGLPTMPSGNVSKDEMRVYRKYLRVSGISEKRMVEVDAIEAMSPGGLARFVETAVSRIEGLRLLDTTTSRKLPGEDID